MKCNKKKHRKKKIKMETNAAEERIKMYLITKSRAFKKKKTLYR